MWKREEDKRKLREAESKRGTVEDPVEPTKPQEADLAHSDSEGTDEERKRGERGHRWKRSSRSQSPRRREPEQNSRRRRSP